MHPEMRKRLLVIAGVTESICGAIEVAQHKSYAMIFVFLGIMFVFLGLAKDKAN